MAKKTRREFVHFSDTTIPLGKRKVAAENYNIEEVKELWRQEPDDNRVFRAATEDIEEYSPEVQTVIKEEAKRRRDAESEHKTTSKQSPPCGPLSSIGIGYDRKQSWLKNVCLISATLITCFITYLFAGATVKSFFAGKYVFGIIGTVVCLCVFWFCFRYRGKKPKDEETNK